MCFLRVWDTGELAISLVVLSVGGSGLGGISLCVLFSLFRVFLFVCCICHGWVVVSLLVGCVMYGLCRQCDALAPCCMFGLLFLCSGVSYVGSGWGVFGGCMYVFKRIMVFPFSVPWCSKGSSPIARSGLFLFLVCGTIFASL